MRIRGGARWYAFLAVAVGLGLLVSLAPVVPTPTGASSRATSAPGMPSVAESNGPRSNGVLANEGLPALAVPSWVNVTPTPPEASPPGVLWGSLSYDPADREVVAFGGCDRAVCPQNYTWVFSDGFWTNITNPHDAPPARFGAMMTYDANMDGVLLFGGVGASSYLNDTWLFSAGSWTNLSWVGPAPMARAFASLAFDPDPEVNGSVLWGGFNPGPGDLNDTWAWESWAGWVQLNPSTAPPPSSETSMAYDPVESALILYGANATSSTWEFQGGQWWQVNTPGPPFRTGAGMVYVPGAAAVFLFGGANNTAYLNDSWSFANGTWSNDTSGLGPAPPPRYYFGLTLDPSGSVPLVFGGTGAVGYMNDTWAIAIPISSSLGASSASTEVSTNVSFTATVSNGIPPYLATFHFGDNVTAQVSGSGPTLVATHAFVNPGHYTAWVNVTDSIGLHASALASAVSVAAGPAISASATPSSVDVGQSVSFSATAISPGVPPITYQWTFGDGEGASGSSPSHAYAAAGMYSVAVVGTDADGVRANANLSVVVVALPTLSVGDNRSSATVDNPIAFYANLSGGTAPFEFSWSFGDGNKSSFPTPFHVFSTAGNFTVQVWTNDSFSVMDHESLTVSIHAASGPPPPTTITQTKTGGMPNWFYPALGGLAAVGLVGSVLLVWRGRRSA